MLFKYDCHHAACHLTYMVSLYPNAALLNVWSEHQHIKTILALYSLHIFVTHKTFRSANGRLMGHIYHHIPALKI